MQDRQILVFLPGAFPRHRNPGQWDRCAESERSTERQRRKLNMKPIAPIVVTSLAITAAGMAANAQAPKPTLNGPVTYVTLAQYNQMVQQGKAVPVDPSVLEQQNAAAESAYQNNLAIVQAYLDAHPDLTSLAAL
jgi:hypothetical protein